MNTWKEYRFNDKIKLDIKDNNIFVWNVKINKFENQGLM